LGEEAAPNVIGTTHRGAIGRVVPGSVGDRLLHGAPCAVSIAPRGFARAEHFGFGLVGVGFDGRPESQRAVAVARRMAADVGARLRIIAAMPPPVREGDRAEQREQLSSGLEESAVFARQPDADGRVVEVETVLRDGDPAEVLADAGVELDLLLAGSRGYGAIRRTMLGGVGSQIIRTCPCPVMIVPRAGGTWAGSSHGIHPLPAVG
jgi:nucleotide-binding universal stress UspA family protein